MVGCGGKIKTERVVGAMTKDSLWKSGRRLILLAVDDSPEGGRLRFIASRNLLSEAGYPPWEEQVVPGRRLEAFSAFCEKENADLVVLGGWGEHRWDDLMGLSVTGGSWKRGAGTSSSTCKGGGDRDAADRSERPGPVPAPVVLPFAGLLLSIALFPVFAPGFWVRHFGKVSLAYGLPVAAYFLASAPRELLHLSMEYVSFIVLLAALFIVSGGILIRGTVRATPGLNCAILAIGALLSNALGTTGASMVLIRPLLRANAGRKRIAHVVIFFIFVVANIGGSLSAIGDPPLFLGYLKGVPFFWTLVHVGPMWVLVCAAVIGVFYLFDRRAFAIDQLAGPAAGSGGTTSADTGVCAVAGRARVSVEGKINLPLLGAVIAAVFLPTPWRETAMVAAAGVSVWLTPAGVREENEFTYHPIEEVAILFAGIFATMLPAMLILKARGGELGVTDPAPFFWATGVLSSFLDNAPT